MSLMQRIIEYFEARLGVFSAAIIRSDARLNRERLPCCRENVKDRQVHNLCSYYFFTLLATTIKPIRPDPNSQIAAGTGIGALAKLAVGTWLVIQSW